MIAHIKTPGLILVSVCASTFVVHAQPVELPKYSVSPSAFTERFVKDRQVSSNGTIIGFQSGSLDVKLRSPEVFVSGLTPTNDNICIVIENRSGSYIGSATFQNPGLGSSIVVELPIEQLRLREYTTSELVVRALASKHENCSFEADYLNVSWEPPEKGATFHLFANLNASDVAFFSVTGQTESQECRPIEVLPGTTSQAVFQNYNFICTQRLLGECKSETFFSLQLEDDGIVRTTAGSLKRSC